MDKISQSLDQLILTEYIIVAVIFAVILVAYGVLWYFIHQVEKRISKFRHSLGKIQDEFNEVQKEYKKIQEEISRVQKELDKTESSENTELSQ